MKKTILAIALSVASIGVASASGFGAGAIAGIGADISGYVGTGGGYASSATTGGSMAQGNVNGTGISAQFTANDGAGYSAAGASIGRDSVVTYTAGGSHAANVSAGFTAGQAQGNTTGAVGTDFSSEAWGAFDTGAAGFTAVIGAGFGSFGSFSGGAVPQ